MGALKCGEILVSFKRRRKENVFTLTCIFCQSSYAQLEQFANHIEDLHNDELLEVQAGDLIQSVDCVLEEPKVESMEVETLEPIAISTQHAEDPLNETIYEEDVDETQNINIDYELQVEQMVELQTDFKEEVEVDEQDNVMYDDGYQMTDHTSTNTSTTEDEADEEEMSLDEASDKELISLIIAGYEQQGILWDPNKKSIANNRKKQAAFKQIATAIQQKHNVNITWQRVSQLIRKLRYKYRKEMHNQKAAESKHENYTPSWCFRKLEFLKESIKYKKRNQRGIHALTNERPGLPLPNLTDAQNSQFIEIYKTYPCLWDMQDIGLRTKHLRKKALDEMLQMVKDQMDIQLTLDDLQKKLYRVRYACTQEKHRKLQCEKLKRQYTPTCKYYPELTFLEPHVGPFQCKKCSVIINGADQFRIHISAHDGIMPFTCPVCQRGFTKAGNCTVHLRRHTRDFAFDCKECGKRFATSTDVNVHMRQHTGEKPYFCEVCGKSFRTWTFFDSHMRRHQKRPAYICNICSRAFYENNKLKQHMNGHLNVRDKVCNVCGKGFTSTKYLHQHKQIHAEKKKYMCKICQKEFAQYASLSRHMKTHGTTLSGIVTEENQEQTNL